MSIFFFFFALLEQKQLCNNVQLYFAVYKKKATMEEKKKRKERDRQRWWVNVNNSTQTRRLKATDSTWYLMETRPGWLRFAKKNTFQQQQGLVEVGQT